MLLERVSIFKTKQKQINLDSYLPPHQKTSQKWITDLNITAKEDKGRGGGGGRKTNYRRRRRKEICDLALGKDSQGRHKKHE